MYHFDASDSRAHADIDTAHEDEDCRHLGSSDDVRQVHYLPEDASVCGTCGSGDSDE